MRRPPRADAVARDPAGWRLGSDTDTAVAKVDPAVPRDWVRSPGANRTSFKPGDRCDARASRGSSGLGARLTIRPRHSSRRSPSQPPEGSGRRRQPQPGSRPDRAVPDDQRDAAQPKRSTCPIRHAEQRASPPLRRAECCFSRIAMAGQPSRSLRNDPPRSRGRSARSRAAHGCMAFQGSGAR
jgi:hypothetical protein